MANCNATLPNASFGCKFDINEIRRFGWTAYKDNGSNRNKIAIADAALLSNIQALFDVPDYRSNTVDNDDLTKLLISQLMYEAMAEQADSVTNNDGGYYVKLADGDLTFTAVLKQPSPYMLDQLKELESLDLSMYLFDQKKGGNARIWGMLDGTDIVPLRLQNVDIPDFIPGSRETPSQVTVTFQLRNPSDMNKLYGVEIVDDVASGDGLGSDITDDSDFYALYNASMTITSPAITGANIVIATDTELGSEPVTGIAFGDWTFRRSDDETDEIVLAAGSSVTESPDGTYVVNEAALLTSGKTYAVEIAFSGFNITAGDIIVP